MAQRGFLDKTLLAVARVAQQSLFAETFARDRGFLQSLDVRVKLLTFLGVLVLISFLHTPETLCFLSVLALVLAALSRVPSGFFLKRVWLFVPLVSALIVLPAVLNIVTPGEPLLVLLKLGRAHRCGRFTLPADIAVTRQGLSAAVVFVSRVGASVSFAVLLTLTTRWSAVFAGLRAIFVPRVFVLTLSLTERYLFVLLRLIQDMYRARKSRTIGPIPTAAERGWTASRVGVTFRKSMDMSDDIYKAMRSRGFLGDFRSLDRFRVSGLDLAWIITVLVIGGLMISFERGLLRA